jgi:hypothetical protein
MARWAARERAARTKVASSLPIEKGKREAQIPVGKREEREMSNLPR